MDKLPVAAAVFIDPDWAITGPDHVYRFKNSNMRPPADLVLDKMLAITGNVALVLPPFIAQQEFASLPPHEREKLFWGASHGLFCLYFGELIKSMGETEFRVSS